MGKKNRNKVINKMKLQNNIENDFYSLITKSLFNTKMTDIVSVIDNEKLSINNKIIDKIKVIEDGRLEVEGKKVDNFKITNDNKIIANGKVLNKSVNKIDEQGLNLQVNERFNLELTNFLNSLCFLDSIEEEEKLKLYGTQMYLHIKDAMINNNIRSMNSENQVKLLFKIFSDLNLEKRIKQISSDDGFLEVNLHELNIFIIGFVRKIATILNVENELDIYITNNWTCTINSLLKKYNMTYFKYEDIKNIAKNMCKNL